MKLKTLTTAAALTAVCLSGSAVAQTAESNVVGFYTLTFNQGFSLGGLQLHNNPLATGTITQEAGPIVADENNDFSGLSTLASTQTLLFEVETGAQAGAVAEVTAVGTTALTLDGALGAGAADYTVRRAATLNELFGGIAVGNSFLTGNEDVVWLPDGSGGFDTYAFNTTGNEFRDATNFFASPAKPIAVFYPDGFFFEKKAAGSVNAVVAGDLKTGGTVVKADVGFNLVASSGPEGVTFGTAGLEGTPPGTFLVGNSFLTGNEDIVWLSDGAGGFVTYAYNTTANVWRDASNFFSGDASNTELTSGYFIERKAANGSTSGVSDVPGFYSGL